MKAITRENLRAKRLKRIVIKEELRALTGSTLDAVVLGQFIYWSERVKDFDDFIKEEKKRDQNIKVDFSHGWIYKSAPELLEEIMMDVSEASIRRSMIRLNLHGWIARRNNPKYSWDKTFQYRVDFKKIQEELWDIGYYLEGYQRLEEEGIIKVAA